MSNNPRCKTSGKKGLQSQSNPYNNHNPFTQVPPTQRINSPGLLDQRYLINPTLPNQNYIR